MKKHKLLKMNNKHKILIILNNNNSSNKNLKINKITMIMLKLIIVKLIIK